MQKGKLGIGGVVFKKDKLNGPSSSHLMRLLDLIEGVNQLNDADAVIAEIGRAAKTLMEAEASALLLLDEEKDEFCIRFSNGPVKNEITGKHIPRDQKLYGWVAEHKLPIFANDINEIGEESIFGGELKNRFVAHNLICAPLLDKNNNLIGVIEAINCSNSQQLTEEDLPIFQAFANHAATAIVRIQTRISQDNRLIEQDMVLTEIHHRVKNDLALISGIVEIESLDMDNESAKNVLQNIQSRIKSMAVVYELLSGEGSHNKTEAGAFFDKLVQGISEGLSSKNKNIDIHIHSDEVFLDPYKTVSCGLIINELMLNSYKYAFKFRSEGSIQITLTKSVNDITISYKDDGPGLPEDFELKEQDSIGFEMIQAFVSQLNGTIEVVKSEGAHFIIRFSLDEKDKAIPLKKAHI